ncbi:MULTISPECIES: prephenate dehydratase [Thermoanaerobacter]|uniref:Prephenate dehydratase n=2 Tax=Thermoanaerobacter TaxID=1754 RepID=B0K925_THEP3|nr:MULTISPECIES: prephenate dehydratase [Thermoanaerobacter]ABY94638.1 Prephenate dehydratase [Thermoanaerobacter pseudethanolicus ATCC 33223]ADV79586.1 Prephenate dehydratase [Thermoanaerobacter brockii subsp. finnii Ako-1]HBW59541.1 prephenate dehydratase [Thermoanaerobacter sp.]
MKIGYLGPKGTFSEEAVIKYTQGVENCEVVEFNTIPEVINCISNSLCEEAVIPIENSIEGSVNIAVDMLINDANGIMIKGEVIIPISHCLISDAPVEFKDVHCILSHQQAIAQCREYISKKFPNAEVKATDSTAQAVLGVKSKPGVVAIGPERAAVIYGMRIIDRNIQDVKENYTRFLILSQKDWVVTGKDKTSIVFSVPNVPGSLYNALGVLANKKINMTKIESRPSRKKLGEYVFWVDIEGHREDEIVKDALEELKGRTDFLKVLGSYPKFK